MAAFRKLLYVPRFDTQSPQTDKESLYNGENNKQHKLNEFTQEATPLLFLDVTSPEITPCFSKTVKTNQLLRLYANLRSTVNLRGSKGGKLRRAKRVTYDEGVGEQSQGDSSDTFGFPPRDVKADEMSRSRTKQDVLRTIKRMVEENRVIRERLLALRQQSRRQ
ncbi:uncharacterized protein si:ch211-277c7.7 [Carassius carassius]|uniref:uncharacterized protein si:ch211-277c7.7 n=1 Tax=Carassius carassius TaxID=217509 RepID=UPI0028686DFB|nr:uncharacterized protein si:ch211-277c7.7 [Carassius carassius]XP_059371426.1 uncharacterized protein si:ch211-277c7.7 [Carassius carassius]XP_059371427.1 uncharacterized protein si:ch211-277c7.7 [Carassius carassius]XP_059371428.1 uncharacterized protein si:ch211-277c7.7 [Carassius carassius]XP_059371429.1 uncharacterized protein si:ch211-277c7.7 [Carassius carassius]